MFNVLLTSLLATIFSAVTISLIKNYYDVSAEKISGDLNKDIKKVLKLVFNYITNNKRKFFYMSLLLMIVNTILPELTTAIVTGILTGISTGITRVVLTPVVVENAPSEISLKAISKEKINLYFDAVKNYIEFLRTLIVN